MKILLSIVINSLILFALAYFLQENSNNTWIIIAWGQYEYDSVMAWKTYLLWWIILWVINLIIRPILGILKIVLFIVSWFITILANAIVLFSLDYILKNILIIEWIWYHINWLVEFIIAVNIFTILNMLYSLLLFKK
jgi:uncharacterized membrane protein YvlD (DUF360 family)